MQVISFISRKGGVGKTTVLFNLALYLARTGSTVALVDKDQDQDLAGMAAAADYPDLNMLEGNTDGIDYVLVDTPGGMAEREFKTYVDSSDLIIVPMRLGASDLKRTQRTAELLNATSKARLLFNAVNRSTRTFEQRTTYARHIGLEPFKAWLAQRAAYNYATVDGPSAWNTNCLKELDTLTREIKRWLKQTKT
jgi:chromosome partitioning protein